MNNYRELLIGCGNSREKRILPYHLSGVTYPNDGIYRPMAWQNLTTLDVDPECGPDIVWNLGRLPYEFSLDNQYNEIHAYEVLEHVGQQGDFCFFFAQFGEFWRILKAGGFLCATVPAYNSQWAFGDPGHTRVITPGSLVFLNQLEYARQLGKTAMSDYRMELGPTNFVPVYSRVQADTFTFILRAVK